MRDFVAGILALVLLFVAASLATTLTMYRRRRRRRRDAERDQGRTVIAEIPGDPDLILFSEDGGRFVYGNRAVDKQAIVAVRVLINGVPIAATVSERDPRAAGLHPTAFEDRPEGIARDRWDVAIETVSDTLLVECGAIRERVSQELARAVFDAVKRDIERRNAA